MMHSSCVISGLSHKGVRGMAGLSQLDKHPGLKTRKYSQACGRRLVLRMAELKKTQQTIQDRISHDLRSLERLLERDEGAESRSTFDAEDKINDKTPRPSPQPDVMIVDEPYKSITRPLRPSRNGRSTSSRRRQRRQVPRLCDYGTHRSSIHCPLFPCRQPQTYHSLGFRPDDSSTNRWVSWADLRRDIPDGGGANLNLSSQAAAQLHRRGFIDSGSLGPSDYKQVLLDRERERMRQRQHQGPHSWVVNYGQPIPYKMLRKPVRLYPLEMTTASS